MTKWLALLRGINVGNRQVAMADLRECLREFGLAEVRTYIASGNALFAADQCEVESLESALQQRFGFEIPVQLRTLDQMVGLVASIPPEWKNDSSQKCDVIFLAPDVDVEDVWSQLPYQEAIEEVHYHPGAIVWRVPRTLQSRSQMPKLVGKPVFSQVTVRNVNTVRKVTKLLSEPA